MSRVAAPEVVRQVEQVCRHIRENPEPPPSLTELAALVDLSPGHLQRVFKRVAGVSPKQYADACRVDRLKAGLRSHPTVTTAMLEAGYGSSSRLYEQAASRLGMTPRAYQKGGPAAVVRFTVGRCDLGRVLLAATEKGVCAVSLGDDAAGLEAWLRAEFPAATVERADAALRGWLQALLDHLAGELPHPALPLDVRGTAFQRRVWEELRKIPVGETRTYAQVAAALGRPAAVRAVARACATNPVSVLTPCHRVVGSDGSLRGYRWGVERKKKLLEREKGDG
ncbi:MAG TPA: methylated-DNA--[protein]-cysteine S-methyltransferase [Fimbriiglobus sp.]|nr:methylated-DNA--[protein]-cysteine S-methyltransferase [Fimbriiglobus sp.]